MESEALRKYRMRNSSEEIAAFCTHFAKQMKKSVYDRLARITPAVIIDEEYIANYYPKTNSAKTRFLLKWPDKHGATCCRPVKYARYAASVNGRKKRFFLTAMKKADTGVPNDKRDVTKTNQRLTGQTVKFSSEKGSV